MKTIVLSALMLVSQAQAGDFMSLAKRGAQVSAPCQSKEKWSLKSGKPTQWLHRYHEFLGGGLTPVGGFAEAVSLRRISALLHDTEFENDFSEYWVGRILFDLKLDPMAHQVFQSVLEHSEQKSIRKAAFACMVYIQNRSPDWKAPTQQVEWGAFDYTEDDAEVIYGASLTRPTKLTALLPTGYRDFYKGVEAIKNRKYTEAHTHLTQFIQFLDTPKIVTRWEKYRDQAHLLLGRALYSTAHFKEAAEHFHKVKKTSNLQIETLSNLSWAYLLQDQHDAAVGVSLQLRTGSLKNAFAPEPLMVAAMALNELCSYQDSIRMVQTFINDYGKSYEWLEKNKTNKEIYGELLRVFKDPKHSTVPSKIATEWMRTPAYLTRQQELNHLIEHPKKLVEVQRRGYQEQMKRTQEFLKDSTQFIQDVRVAKQKLKPGQDLDPQLGERFLKLKRELRRLSRYYRSSKIWKNLAKNYEKRIPNYRKMVVEQINKDLVGVNKQLLATLKQVRENSDWIEVEIYNGASQDLVWREAHPDFEKVTQEMGSTEEEAPHAKVWKWGRFLASDIDQAEVWEDEVGTLKADVANQCDKKDKYMKIKLTRRSSP